MSKTKNRPMYCLLQILYDKVVHSYGYGGLCTETDELYFYDIITYYEHTQLYNYIKENKPFLAKLRTDYFYWNEYKKKPRLRWLNKHIKKMKYYEWNRRINNG